MILQYSNGITECYEESTSISVGKIEVKKEWCPLDAINEISSRIKGVWGEQTFEFRKPNIFKHFNNRRINKNKGNTLGTQTNKS